MNKLELIEIIAQKNDITKALAGRILNSINETIIQAVKEDQKVVMVGFGTFCQYNRQARNARNPINKEMVRIPASPRPKFVPGTAFRNAVDPDFEKNCKAAIQKAHKKTRAKAK
jgi:DNA-binding protein HU-beta